MKTLTALTAIFLPLNLITGFFGMNFENFPFIKTELVAKNPARVVDAADWEAMVPPDAPCPVPVLSEHLRLLRETPERH
jgi:hypothetical protein